MTYVVTICDLINAVVHQEKFTPDFGHSAFTRPGKRLHNYGTSSFSMGKSTISMAIFNSFLYVYQRVP